MDELMLMIQKGEFPDRKEFDALNYEDAQQCAAQFRRLHTNDEICKHWHCASNSVTYFFNKYQIVKIKGGTVLVGADAEAFQARCRANRNRNNNQAQAQPQINIVQAHDNLLVSINRDFTSDELKDFITRLGLFIDSPETRYMVELKVKERTVAQN